jgi:hypothetical protein
MRRARVTLVGGLGLIAVVTALGACSSSARHTAVAGRTSVGLGKADVAGPAVDPAGVPSSGEPAKPELVTSAKIRTADMTIAVPSAAGVARAADAADAVAAKYGGEVFGDQRTSGREAAAVVTLKVPPATLGAVLHDLSALGHEKSRSESTEDVTGEVVDVDTRVANLQKMITALETLYDPSHRKLSELIDLEQQISQRVADLESLQAQQRALHAQTDTATVTLTVETQAAARHHVTGFLGGLRKGWDAFVRGAQAVALGLGAAIPFAVLIVLLALGLRIASPRLARRTPPPAPAASGAAPAAGP